MKTKKKKNEHDKQSKQVLEDLMTEMFKPTDQGSHHLLWGSAPTVCPVLGCSPS